MKTAVTYAYTFTPGASNVGTLNLASIPSFNIKKLYSVVNVTANEIIYASGLPQYGLFSLVGSTLTLAKNTSSMNSADQLLIIYDDPAEVIKTDGSATTQPVNGTVAVSNAFALDATLTGGTAKTVARTAAKGTTTAADLTSTNQSSDRQALDVQIRTSAGAPVDSFGGGTEYADGAARGTATGKLILGDDGTNLQSVKVDAAGELQVDVLTMPTVTVTGTVNANATLSAETTKVIGTVNQGGTWNVTNVSGTVSLPTGASTLTEQQTQTTALQLIDDAIVADNAAFTDGTTKLAMSGFIYDEVAGTALTENDAAAGRINVNRALVSTIEDGATRGRYATVTATNAVKVDGSAVTQPVSLAANQSVNVAQINGVTPLMGNGVTGTGSQRVTIASDNTAFPVNATLSAETTKVIGTINLAAAQTLATVTTVSAVTAITNALPVGANRIGSVRPVDSADADLTSAKATQTARAMGVQNLKDAGRTNINFYAVGAATGTTGTETAITLTKASGTSATATGTSFVITSGKTFRITSISFASRGHATATAQVSTFNLRINTAGAVTTTSTPLVLSARSATPATSSAWDRVLIPIPDGMEYAGNGTIQFGVTANAVYVTNAPTWDVTITGFEY